MKPISYALISILMFGHVAYGQEESKADDGVLKQAQEISAATGRPIFAVAGQST